MGSPARYCPPSPSCTLCSLHRRLHSFQFLPPPCSLDMQQWCPLPPEALHHESFLAPNGPGPPPPASLYLPSQSWAQRLWNQILFPPLIRLSSYFNQWWASQPQIPRLQPLVPPSSLSHGSYWDVSCSLSLPGNASYMPLLTGPSSGAGANSVRVLPSRTQPRVYISGQGQNEQVQSISWVQTMLRDGSKRSELETSDCWPYVSVKARWTISVQEDGPEPEHQRDWVIDSVTG